MGVGVGVGVNMSSFQTEALVATPIEGDNLTYPTQLYDYLGMCAPIKLSFLFCKRKPLFDALSNVYQTDVWSV